MESVSDRQSRDEPRRELDDNNETLPEIHSANPLPNAITCIPLGIFGTTGRGVAYDLGCE